MKYLHTMVRVSNLESSLDFYCNTLGLKELRRYNSEQGRFTLVFLAAPGDETAQVELTYNWDPEDYGEGRNFGHLAFSVPDIYTLCEKLQNNGVAILRPPRDGRMAFVGGAVAVVVYLVADLGRRHLRRAVDPTAFRIAGFSAETLAESIGEGADARLAGVGFAA